MIYLIVFAGTFVILIVLVAAFIATLIIASAYCRLGGSKLTDDEEDNRL